MNDERTPEQIRKIKEYSKKARAGTATSWRPKAYYWRTPEEAAEVKRKIREEYKARMRRQADSDDGADEK